MCGGGGGVGSLQGVRIDFEGLSPNVNTALLYLA